MDPEQKSRLINVWEKHGVLEESNTKSEIIEGDCGPIVSSYNHRQAVVDGYCNDFDLRCDFGVSRLNVSREQLILESILRAMIANKYTRGLTFHSSVVKGVNIFTDELLMNAWEYIGKPDGFSEPEIIHLSAKTKDRHVLLEKFENVPDYGIYSTKIVILSSCRTIGEGIDTKKAQLVAFADPKKCPAEILQNIGRVCRSYEGMKVATVLIPVIVNKDKYSMVVDDEIQRNKIIQDDFRKGGDFNNILRVISALRQLDPDLYSLLWSFPNSFSPSEVKDNLLNQGCSVMDKRLNTHELLQNYQGCENVNIAMTEFADKIGVAIEMHSTCTKNPIQRFGIGETSIVVIYDNRSNSFELLQKTNNNKLNKPTRRMVQLYMDYEVMVLWHTTDALNFVAKKYRP